MPSTDRRSKHRSCPPTARGERLTREIQRALAGSEQRLADKIVQLGAKLDEQTRVSRRRFVTSSALGVAGVATGILGLTTVNQPQRGGDVEFGAVLDHDVRGGGETQIKNISTHFGGRPGSMTVQVDVVPAAPPKAFTIGKSRLGEPDTIG